jgi:hypothetical protein
MARRAPVQRLGAGLERRIIPPGPSLSIRGRRDGRRIMSAIKPYPPVSSFRSEWVICWSVFGYGLYWRASGEKRKVTNLQVYILLPAFPAELARADRSPSARRVIISFHFQLQMISLSGLRWW